MSYYKFEQSDIFTNRIKTHPRSYFLINNNKTYYNKDVVPITDDINEVETIHDTPQGFLSLYEMNINRVDGVDNSGLIYPFITKQGTLDSFKTISTESFQGFSYGDKIEGKYPLSASISTDLYKTVENRERIHSLVNTFNYYTKLSRHYAVKGLDWDKLTQDIKLISIPSIFYGSSIKKGSVKLDFYINGELTATVEDKARNGELVQTYVRSESIPAESSFEILDSALNTQPGDNNDFLDLDGKFITLEDVNGETLKLTFSVQFGSFGGGGIIDPNGHDGGGEEEEPVFDPTESIVFAIIDTNDLDSTRTQILAGIEHQVEIRDFQVSASHSGNKVTFTGNVADLSLMFQPMVEQMNGGIIEMVEDGPPQPVTIDGVIVSSGEAVISEGEGNGRVAGVVLYNEGFVALTGSWDLSATHQEEYIINAGNDSPKWIYWGQKDTSDIDQQQQDMDNDGEPDFAISSSWDISFLGTNYIPTMTMLAHAKQGDLNYSNNPTFIEYNDRASGYEVVTQEMIDDIHTDFIQEDLGKLARRGITSPNKFVEDKELHIANVVKSPYPNTSGSFEKTTYISKIGIYDENKNLIGIAKLATPVKKTESRQYTFKMKVDF